MTQINDKEFYKNNELHNLKSMKFLIPGTTDAAKLKLSDEGIRQFERIVESLPSKDQVLIRMQVAGNAEKTPAQVKAFMQ